MKKIVISGIALGMSVLLLSGIVFARELKVIQALDENFFFYLNDSDMPWYIPMVTIDGHSYVETRSFCKIFGIGVEWEPEEKKIRLETPKAEPSEFDFELSEEAALKYAEAIFQDLFIQEYLDTMKISIAKDGDLITGIMGYMTEKISDPDQYYFVTCIPKDLSGRDFMLVIKKSDGRIIEVMEGE